MSVVSLHLGQAGVQLGDICWLQYTVEHGLDENGFLSPDRVPKSHSTLTLRSERSLSNFAEPLDKVSHNFFEDIGDGSFAPIALFADMEPTVIDCVRSGHLRKLYRPWLLVNGIEDAANNYARGCYNYSRKFDEQVSSSLRKLVEGCDRVQGFIVYHSICGGTGSGYNAHILKMIKEENPKSSVHAVSINPSPKMSTAVVEPYNAVLMTNSTLDKIDCVFQADNEAMYNICVNQLGSDNPTYSSLNRLLATTISSITASLRFKGSLNADFHDFQTNLVPYPRIHFAMISYAPFVSGKKVAHESLSITDLSLQVFKDQHRLSTCETDSGRYMACCLLYRGDVTPKDVNYAIAQIKSKASARFVSWCPTGIKVGLNLEPTGQLPVGEMEASPRSVCMVSNNTAVQKFWAALNFKYDAMLKKKAFVHWYTSEGMEYQEFIEARSNLATLEEDYNELA